MGLRPAQAQRAGLNPAAGHRAAVLPRTPREPRGRAAAVVRALEDEGQRRGRQGPPAISARRLAERAYRNMPDGTVHSARKKDKT